MNRKPKGTRNSELEVIDRFQGLRALVVGDIMLDVYEFCRTGDSKPIDSEKAGKRAYKAQETIKVLGGAGNVAANLAALDVRTALVGVTGNDEHYFKIRDLADGLSIQHGLIRDEIRPRPPRRGCTWTTATCFAAIPSAPTGWTTEPPPRW